jgi:hypothetical protein
MDWTAIGTVAGTAGVGLGFGRVYLGFARRPRLTLLLDTDHVHSRVEAGLWPYVRILAQNGKYRRGAKGARVLVESYRSPGQTLAERVTLGSPSLGWTSGGAETKADGSLTLPPGVSRPLDLGRLVGKGMDAYGQPQPPSMANPSGLQLGLHDMSLVDGRDWIPYGRWIIRLIATADEAATQTYDVTIEWSPVALTENVLDSVIASIAKV